MPDKSPAFQFYPKDFLTDEAVVLMSNEQIGAYIVLLCRAWLSPEGLPSSLDDLARLVKVTPSRFGGIWAGISCKFQQHEDGRWFNHRLEKIRKEQTAHRAERSESGKRGAAKMWASRSHGSAIQQPLAIDGSSSSTASATAIKNKKDPAADAADGFAEFWLGYPRKDNRKDAEKAWKALPASVRGAVMADVPQRRRSEAWTKDGGKFIPYAATYLRGRRWEDEGIKWNPSARSDNEPCQGCGNPEGQCADVKVCNARWLAQNRLAAVETA